MRILILEDDRTLALLIERVLDQFTTHHHQTTTTRAGAAELLASWSPDLLISDLNVTDSNRAETIEWITKLTLPVVISTSAELGEVARDILEPHKARLWIWKKLGNRELIRLVEEALQCQTTLSPAC